MNSQTGYLIFLVGLTLLWFVVGIATTFVFAFSLKVYTDSGDSANSLMLLSLLSLILFPGICAHTIINGWKRFLADSYGGILKVALIPFPLMGIFYFLYDKAWP